MSAYMGRLETAITNSPLRAPFARDEIRRFQRMADIRPDASILEVGCGAGLTTRAIARIMRPSRLAAIDADDAQTARARRRLRDDARVEIRTASATSLPFGEDEFDAVIVIGVLHHIPAWRSVLPEISRVLRRGGSYCFAEPTKLRLTRGVYRIFPHPPEAMFEPDELRIEIERAGFTVNAWQRTMLWSIFGCAVRA
jgi:ubiquinone/menaquinone biosynthesis C-methylase UbiE